MILAWTSPFKALILYSYIQETQCARDITCRCDDSSPSTRIERVDGLLRPGIWPKVPTLAKRDSARPSHVSTVTLERGGVDAHVTLHNTLSSTLFIPSLFALFR